MFKDFRFTAAFALLAFAGPGLAQVGAEPPILITGARIFDGVGPELIEGQDVLVQDGMIAAVGADLSAPEGAVVIHAGGRVMTPGFIDVHYHLSLCNVPVADMAGSNAPDLDYIGIKAAQAAEEALMRGYTSLRDVGGASWGAKLAADRDEIAGPRVWPSLRAISQFGGHGDANPRFMDPREFGGPENNLERLGYSRIVNGRAEVLTAVREQLKRGASQIKMHLAGGVGTEFDPIDGRQFTADEIRAAVEVAEGFGTYVTAHVYTVDGVKQAIENGVKAIEHGNLINEEIAQMMAENDVWLSPQVVVYLTFSPDLGPVRLEKGRMVSEGLDTMFELAKKYDLKIAFGTDVVVNPEACADQNREFVERTKWFTPAEVLAQATSLSGELLQLSGDRNPYPGKIGVIEAGAHADLLLIDGNPLEDISILRDYEGSLDLIMKAGKIYKDDME
ncbi:amidohydrolase family protein [Salipiger sp. PrR002]|uniref:metal-dependent hydrolase family protein n=1 Tax=Salipiger sp. PrR002 TaxID=2706489 RepID=UPI0013BCFF24|nr:amidohydrolase family protein [Salipiger sp. PrR002]NDW02034.1 amidohydrolase family protein [Salipiger sp. PrR002]NDW59128.1 amidohydrolase family protein [Salipiger sp. PrR004]